MMGGRRLAQEPLFYEFSQEGYVPADYLFQWIRSGCRPLRARRRTFDLLQ